MKKPILFIGLATIVLGFLAWFFFHEPIYSQSSILTYLQAFSPGTIVSLFTLMGLLAMPVAPIELASGLLFGPLWGTLYVFLGGLVAAVISFFLTRYLFSDWVAKKLNQKASRLQSIVALVEQKGWKAVALLRLSTVIPFSPLNYAFGLTKIKVWHYLIGTALFMLPPTALYVYIGSLGQQAANQSMKIWVLKLIPALVLLIVLTLIGKTLKKELSRPQTTLQN